MTAKEFAAGVLEDAAIRQIDPVDIIGEMKSILNASLNEQEKVLREKLTAVTTLLIRLGKV